MARASTPTLLPLDTFARLVGLHPLHFNQVQVDEIATPETCDSPVLQYGWQDSGRVGREEIAQAIAEAEDLIAQHLGFDVAPRFRTSKIVLDRARLAEYLPAAGYSPSGRLQALRLPVGYVAEGGVEGLTTIQAGAVVAYTDADGDTYKETATVTVPTTVTEPGEIAVFFPGSTDWEVRPIKVSIAGGNATITCRREQLVDPDLQEGLTAEAVDGLSDTNFVATVDVYRRFTDKSSQAVFEWAGFAVDPVQNTQDGYIVVREARNGIVGYTPGTYAAGAWTQVDWLHNAAPSAITFSYKAGMPLEKGAIPLGWARTITYLALARLSTPFCSCDFAEKTAAYWREDLAFVASGDSPSSFRVSQTLLENPLGTTRAAVYAWRLIQQQRLGEAVRA